ncbi:unnamed protein product [Citrullus colocynthis]|uniref:KxDL domain-containing protein n=1 Tax=Citrullus colocynthis TaxID=252529 RepID=A0ABP0Y788_9ROSI
MFVSCVATKEGIAVNAPRVEAISCWPRHSVEWKLAVYLAIWWHFMCELLTSTCQTVLEVRLFLETMEQRVEGESIRIASEELSQEFKTLMNTDDLNSLNHLQHLILGRLQDSNAVLSHFNEFSEHCFAAVSGDLSRNTRLLNSMKSDLDYIFQKIRSMKSRILATYPDAFPDESTSEVLDRRPDLEIPR